MRALEDWAEATVPWIRREALDSFVPLLAHVAEILEWWQGEGKLKTNWVKTVQNRIRTQEQRRLVRLAQAGRPDARVALRDPTTWAVVFDARARAAKAAGIQLPEPEVLRPTGGKVVSLGRQRTNR